MTGGPGSFAGPDLTEQLAVRYEEKRRKANRAATVPFAQLARFHRAPDAYCERSSAGDDEELDVAPVFGLSAPERPDEPGGTDCWVGLQSRDRSIDSSGIARS